MNPGVVFDILKVSDLSDTAKKQAEQLYKIETTETKRVLFLFYHIILIFERHLLKSNDCKFINFYKEFYEYNDELMYKPGLEYKISGKDFYKVHLSKPDMIGSSPSGRILQYTK